MGGQGPPLINPTSPALATTNAEVAHMSSSAKVDTTEAAIAHLQRNSTNFDARYTLKVLRNLPLLYKQTTDQQLSELVWHTFDHEYAAKVLELADLPGVSSDESSDSAAPQSPKSALAPEVDAFVHLLVLVWRFKQAKTPQEFTKVASVGKYVLQYLQSTYNRRSLDHFVAKTWFYYQQAAERAGQLHDNEVYSAMMQALRTATLRNDFETQSMLITLLLRTLVETNRVGMAVNLISKTSFQENRASNSLAARYYYYLARISAIELDYSTAFEQITAAIRKVPYTPAATGFLQTANKLSVLVELLTGDIPPRKAFGSKEQPELVGPLSPYLALAKAVRAGDVAQFEQAISEHSAAFKHDGNLSLAKRLRQNVIKTGIRVISLTYSKISLKDVCIKLGLDSEENAEYIVAKSIRDGVIEATINHQSGYMQSLDMSDVYATKEPQIAFDERIVFSMGLHDDNVKALHYLTSDNASDLRDVQEALEREKELVTEIQENSDLEDDEGDFDF